MSRARRRSRRAKSPRPAVLRPLGRVEEALVRAEVGAGQADAEQPAGLVQLLAASPAQLAAAAMPGAARKPVEKRTTTETTPTVQRDPAAPIPT
jgi:hypothetical protein